MLCEMQSVSSRIWTRVAVSISYDDNHYTTGTAKGYEHCLSNYLPIAKGRIDTFPKVCGDWIMNKKTIT